MSKVEKSFDVAIDVTTCKQKLEAAGWSVTEVGDGLQATQGSQAPMRLLGGNFINADKLPKQLSASPSGDGTAIHAEDTVGMGRVGGTMKKKYHSAFDKLETLLS